MIIWLETILTIFADSRYDSLEYLVLFHAREPCDEKTSQTMSLEYVVTVRLAASKL